MKEQTTSSTSMSFTKQGLVDWLTSRGATAVMDTRAVAAILERDMQTIRRYAKRGELKCDMRRFNKAVYYIGDVAEFLLANPSLCVFNSETLELNAERIALIRRIGFHAWRPLLDACGADDVFSEVQMRLMQTRLTNKAENAIGAVIERLFANIYRKYRRKIDTISFDENRKMDNSETNVIVDTEDSRATCDTEEDEQAIRAEAVQMMMNLPIDYIRAFLRHCPKIN